MLHLLSVITAAAILAAGVGLVSAETIQKEPTQKASPVAPRAAPAPQAPEPAAEGRSAQFESDAVPAPEDEEEEVIIAPED